MIADPDDLGADLATDQEPHRSWTQLHLGSAELDMGVLRRVISAIVERCAIPEWHYVLMEPGIRLRFLGDPDATGLEDLAALGQSRRVVYEPEVHRFGGLEGLATAHTLFTADSGWALELLAGAPTGFDRAEWSMIVVNDLAVRMVGDRAELWDLWKRLETVLHGEVVVATSHVPLDQERIHDVLTFGPAFIGGLTDNGHRMIAAARSTNVSIAGRLAGLGSSSIGPRSWLAAATVFHWNRLALTLDDLRPLVAAVLRELDGP